jgi:hypothetical protein
MVDVEGRSPPITAMLDLWKADNARPRCAQGSVIS